METETTSTDDTGTGSDTQPDLQAEVDKWKALARKHEERATANADAAQQLEALQQESKSDADKVAERIAKLEQENARATADALRLRVAAKHKISDEDADLFLTGTDEAALTAQAKRLSDRNAENRRSATVVDGEGNQSSQVGGSDMREFTSQLFARD